MTKKLVMMIPTEGKTKEQIFEEAKKVLKDKGFLKDDGKIEIPENEDEMTTISRKIGEAIRNLTPEEKELAEFGSEVSLKQEFIKTQFDILVGVMGGNMSADKINEAIQSVVEMGRKAKADGRQVG